MKKAQTPQEWYDIFTEALEGGDLEQTVNLFDVEAVFVVQPGQLATDADSIRTGLQGFIAMQPTLNFERVGMIVADNICFARANWTLTGTGQDGSPIHMEGESTDVFRRQEDGSWRILVDNAYGVV